MLDLACGEGIYARKIRAAGAAEVVGVDISHAMIALAVEAETKEPLGCRYVVADIAGLGRLGEFDVVTGMYLLNYARSRGDLLAFCQAIHANLASGGRFVGFNDNVANPAERFSTYQRYGFTKTTVPPLVEGTPITYTLQNPDGSRFSFDNYHLAPAAYAEAFAAAGFASFDWRGPWLADEGRAAFPVGYWDDFMAWPPLIGVEAVR